MEINCAYLGTRGLHMKLHFHVQSSHNSEKLIIIINSFKSHSQKNCPVWPYFFDRSCLSALDLLVSVWVTWPVVCLLAFFQATTVGLSVTHCLQVKERVRSVWNLLSVVFVWDNPEKQLGEWLWYIQSNFPDRQLGGWAKSSNQIIVGTEPGTLFPFYRRAVETFCLH